jgi:hypothetical protein
VPSGKHGATGCFRGFANPGEPRILSPGARVSGQGDGHRPLASLCSDSSIDRVCRMRLSTLAKPHCGESSIVGAVHGRDGEACWDREFADSSREESGFEPLVPLPKSPHLRPREGSGSV